MKSVYNRLICFLLILLMLPMGLLETAIPVKAAYENTYVNTGDQRSDIIGVALTQVGYKEGANNNNYTKYGEWYGHPNMAWCAVFISWCADQAGIPTSVLQKNGHANAAAFGLSSFTASQRTPQPGDLFFRGGEHAGIIYKVEGSIFYAIEGNTWTSADSRHGVMIRQRDLYSSSFTFASPNYQGSSNSGSSNGCSHSYVKGADSAHPHKEYYKCSKCNYMYYTGTEKTVDGCLECKMENCSHQYGSWEKVDGTYHSTTCSLCTKVSKLEHSWGSDEIIEEATCEEPGLKTQTCKQCGATRETEIPATNEHQFGEWAYADNDSHFRVCEACEKEEEGSHTISDWGGDTRYHWKECADCGGRIDVGEHLLSGDCGSACVICDLTPNTDHMYTARWSTEKEGHYRQCVNCFEILSEQAHDYSADCDETCDTCGYVRTARHDYGTDWLSDKNGHWVSCSECGHIKQVRAHIPGTPATEDQPQLCTACGYEITSILLHIHDYTYNQDARTHSGSCDCGETVETEGHLWDLETGKCQICQADVPPIPQETLIFGIKAPNLFQNPRLWQIILLVLAVLAVLILTVVIVAAVKKRIRAAAAAALQRELEEESEAEESADAIESLDDIESEEELVSV